MLYAKQPSPASSTSTVDQQEIIFDDVATSQLHHQFVPHLHQLNAQQICGVGAPTTSSARANSFALNASLTSNNHTSSFISAATTNQTINNINFNLSTNSMTSINNTNAPTTSNKRQSNSSYQPRGTKRVANNKSTPPKRPKLFQTTQQVAPWKALQHHFLRYTDIKFRPEKRMTMAELGNEVLQRRNGWKIHHLVGQLTDLIQNEQETRKRVESMMNIFVESGASKVHDLVNNCHKLPEQYATLLQSQRSYGRNEFKSSHIVTKMDDLLKGDLQRSTMFDDQLNGCRESIIRITNEHRDRVARITTKFNKRIQL